MSDNSTINHMAEGWQEDHDALEHCKEQLEYAKSEQYTAVLHLNQVKLRDAEIEALKLALSQLIVAGERYKSGDGEQWAEYLNFGNAIDKAKEALK